MGILLKVCVQNTKSLVLHLKKILKFFKTTNKVCRSDPIFFLKQLDEVTFITKTQGVTCFIDGHSGR